MMNALFLKYLAARRTVEQDRFEQGRTRGGICNGYAGLNADGSGPSVTRTRGPNEPEA